MNASTGMEKMLDDWSELQTKWWKGFQSNLSAPWERLYSQTFETCELAGSEWIRSQSDWSRIWLKSLGLSVSKENSIVSHQWSQDLVALGDRWGETQQSVWHNWCQLIKDIGPLPRASSSLYGMSGKGDETTGMQVVRDVIRESMKSQAAWVSLFIPGHTDQSETVALGEGPQEIGDRHIDQSATVVPEETPQEIGTAKARGRKAEVSLEKTA